MALHLVTHSGPFHADDVLAAALLRHAVDPALSIERTRDTARIAAADVVVDVGGIFDPASLRFDHHQASYTGPRSSAGMVLDWLVDSGRVSARDGARLREGLVDYVDDVDNGRRTPAPGVPCFAGLVAALARTGGSRGDHDAAFAVAVGMAEALLRGTFDGFAEEDRAEAVVVAAMEAAAAAGSNAMVLGEYVPWKPAYFAHGGASHPTDTVLHPGPDGAWRAAAIPPALDSFAQKRPLPEAWAGLTDDALAAACGVPGARFCHKNRFICVFDTFEHLVAALAHAGHLVGPLPQQG